MLKRANRLPGQSALLIAGGQEVTAIFLLDHGANSNVADENGFTPLHFTRVNGLALVNRARKNKNKVPVEGYKPSGSSRALRGSQRRDCVAG
jgi:ankyrin repeat protein